MNTAKVRLSQTEMELVNNADVILTKNAILKKVNRLLGALQEQQQKFVAQQAGRLPEKISGSTFKISKGENYKGLPYLILDYPRLFGPENIFAVRTMFWWGNFFSVTLHLSGLYKKEAEEKLISSFEFLKEKGYYCTLHDDQWEHHYEEGNYVPLSELSSTDFERSVRVRSFIKVTNKISLQQWEDAPEILEEFFKDMINMMAD